MSSNERQYRSYLDYVENIGNSCGFEVEEDVLRIPSTKRVRVIVLLFLRFLENACSQLIKVFQFSFETINCEIQVCHIGKTRTYPKEDEISIKDEILNMLRNSRHGNLSETRSTHDFTAEKHCQTHAGKVHASSSCHHDNTEIDQSRERQFIPRSNTEPVRNCTKIDQKVLDEIVHKVVSELLSRSQGEEFEKCKNECREASKNWNMGGNVINVIPGLRGSRGKGGD